MKKVIVLVGFVFGFCFSVCQAEVRYSVTDLGTLGGDYSIAVGVNDLGQVVGLTDVEGYVDRHAFLYDDGMMHDIGVLGGEHSIAYDINESGHVVGHSSTGDGYEEHAFLYDGSMHDLGTLGGASSYAKDINDSGQIVGMSISSDGVTMHAFLYENGTMTDLDNSNYDSAAHGINESGQVVWHRDSMSRGETSSLLIYDDTSTNIPDMMASAYGINDSGDIVGGNRSNGETVHAFLYSEGVTIDLGTLGGNKSYANAINDFGQIIGHSSIDMEDRNNVRAFVYDDVDGMVDLNDLIAADSGWILNLAYDINSSGQIVGGGLIDGEIHGYLLTPTSVPEPCGLVLVGLGGLWLRRRRGME